MWELRLISEVSYGQYGKEGVEKEGKFSASLHTCFVIVTDAGLYGAVYLATVLISNVVTNNAAAALVFPIAMNAADQTGADRRLMAFTLMLGASASFATPFGYTTNLMVYGPGGYKAKDFLLIGAPMQVLLWIVSVVVVSTASNWWISWIITSVIFMLVVAVRLTGGAAGLKRKSASDGILEPLDTNNANPEA